MHGLDARLGFLGRLDQLVVNHIDLLHHVVFQVTVDVFDASGALQRFARCIGGDMTVRRRLVDCSHGPVQCLEFVDDEQLMAQDMRPCFSPVAGGIDELRMLLLVLRSRVARAAREGLPFRASDQSP